MFPSPLIPYVTECFRAPPIHPDRARDTPIALHLIPEPRRSLLRGKPYTHAPVIPLIRNKVFDPDTYSSACDGLRLDPIGGNSPRTGGVLSFLGTAGRAWGGVMAGNDGVVYVMFFHRAATIHLVSSCVKILWRLKWRASVGFSLFLLFLWGF